MRKYLLLLFAIFYSNFIAFAQLNVTVRDITVCNNNPVEVCAVKPFVTLSNVKFDDEFSKVIEIGFPFKFYGRTYTQLVISDNNLISFGKRLAGARSNYVFRGARKSRGLDNSIMFPLQDLNIAIGNGKVSYMLEGEAPNRRFIVEFCNVSYFSASGRCTDLKATDQLILNETTNTIEMHIQKKEVCGEWPDWIRYTEEKGVQGIRGDSDAEEVYVPDRGIGDENWSVTVPEAKIFEPVGKTYVIRDIPYNPAKFFYDDGGFSWYKEDSKEPFATGNCIQIIPDLETKYYVVKYDGFVGCNALVKGDLSDRVFVNYTPVDVPHTLTVCKQDLPFEWKGVTIPKDAVSNPNWGNVLVHNPDRCDDNFLVSLNVTDVVNPEFDQLGPFCSGTKFELPTVDKNGVVGKWSPEVNNNKTTTYTFESENKNVCTKPITMEVVITSGIKPIFDPIPKICEGTLVSPLPTVSKNDVSGTWSPAFNNKETTRYVFTPASALCTDEVSLTVEVQKKNTPTFDELMPVCKGDPLNLPLVSKEGIQGTWTTTEGDTENVMLCTFNPNPNECVIPVTLRLQILSIPQAGILFDTDAHHMLNDPINFVNNTIIDNGDFEGVIYDWDFGDGSKHSNLAQPPAHLYAKTGTYIVKLKVTNAIGCRTSEKIVKVNILGYPKAQFTSDKAQSCIAEAISFTNTSSSDNNPIVQMNWYFDDGVDNAQDKVFYDEKDIGVTRAIKYPYAIFTDTKVKVVLIVKTATGHTSKAEKIITLIPSPELIFTDEVTSSCQFDASYQFEVKELRGVEGYGEFTGAGVSTHGVFTPALVDGTSANITYTFYPKYGCVTSINKTVPISKLALIVTPENMTVFENDIFRVNPIYYGKIKSYHWVDANDVEISTDAAPTFSFKDDQLLTLKVVNQEGCVTERKLSILVYNEIGPSNAFSPNGDGINDVWDIPNLKKYGKSSQVAVYNRNGQLVYMSQGYDKPWDGKVNNSVLPFGTYFYVITKPFGKRKISGSVTILK